jgi:tmRNA-binding protein
MAAMKYGSWKWCKFRSNYDHICRGKRKYDKKDATKKRKRNRDTPRTAGINKTTHLQAQRKNAQIWQ